MSTGRILLPDDLPLNLSSVSSAIETEEAQSRHGKTLREVLKETERSIISRALAQNLGNRMKTARDLGMSRRALQYKIEEYGLGAEREG